MTNPLAKHAKELAIAGGASLIGALFVREAEAATTLYAYISAGVRNDADSTNAVGWSKLELLGQDPDLCPPICRVVDCDDTIDGGDWWHCDEVNYADYAGLDLNFNGLPGNIAGRAVHFSALMNGSTDPASYRWLQVVNQPDGAGGCLTTHVRFLYNENDITPFYVEHYLHHAPAQTSGYKKRAVSGENIIDVGNIAADSSSCSKALHLHQSGTKPMRNANLLSSCYPPDRNDIKKDQPCQISSASSYTTKFLHRPSWNVITSPDVGGCGCPGPK